MFYTLLQHLQESGDAVMKGMLAELETMLAKGKMELPISLLFAASKNDDMLLQQLLKKGSDPNEMDRNRKTTLVRKCFLLCEHIHILIWMRILSCTQHLLRQHGLSDLEISVFSLDWTVYVLHVVGDPNPTYTYTHYTMYKKLTNILSHVIAYCSF